MELASVVRIAGSPLAAPTTYVPAPTWVKTTPHEFEGGERFPHGRPRHGEILGELTLGGQPAAHRVASLPYALEPLRRHVHVSFLRHDAHHANSHSGTQMLDLYAPYC
jgi:hypothetical protein